MKSPPILLPELDMEHVKTYRCTCCGGYITADRRYPTIQVQRHQRSVEHVAANCEHRK